MNLGRVLLIEHEEPKRITAIKGSWVVPRALVITTYEVVCFFTVYGRPPTYRIKFSVSDEPMHRWSNDLFRDPVEAWEYVFRLAQQDVMS